MTPSGTLENRSKIANLAKKVLILGDDEIFGASLLNLEQKSGFEGDTSRRRDWGGASEQNKRHTFASLRGATSRDMKITRGNLHYQRQILTKGKTQSTACKIQHPKYKILPTWKLHPYLVLAKLSAYTTDTIHWLQIVMMEVKEKHLRRNPRTRIGGIDWKHRVQSAKIKSKITDWLWKLWKERTAWLW